MVEAINPENCPSCKDHRRRLDGLERQQQDRCPEKFVAIHKRVDGVEKEKVGFGLLKLFTGILVAVLLAMGGFTVATKLQLYALTTEVRVLAETVNQHMKSSHPNHLGP